MWIRANSTLESTLISFHPILPSQTSHVDPNQHRELIHLLIQEPKVGMSDRFLYHQSAKNGPKSHKESQYHTYIEL